jgi:N-carbamoyl-L-amino-acid hydrolase
MTMTAASRAGGLRVDRDRLWASLDRSAEIGAIAGGGLGRLALTDADREMRELFIEWCRADGLEVSVDRIGNIFALRPGIEPECAPVLIGSHLDTQVHGGRFDGVLGVLGALEVIRTLNDNAVVTRRPVQIVSWTDEEGARFHTSMLGSSAFTGLLRVDQALAKSDADGVTVAAELDRIGFAGDAPVPGPSPHAYLELHIEQNAILDEAGVDVGIVDRCYPIYHLDVVFEGRTAHSGPTPMPKRRNATVGAAHAIVAVDRIAREHAPDAKSTTSTLSTWPNRSGIISSHAEVRFDFRHPDVDVIERMRAEIEQALQDAAAAANVTATVRSLTRFGAWSFDDACIAAIENAARRRGVSHMRMATQAGHDAMVVAEHAPTAMIFCPCVDGITHHPDEDVQVERVIPSVEVLLEAMLELAEAQP